MFDTRNFTCPSPSTIEASLPSATNFPLDFVAIVTVTRNCTQGSAGCFCIDDGSGVLFCQAFCPTAYFVAAGPNVTASFDSAEGTPNFADVSVVPKYETVQSPGTPTRSGFTFEGWDPSLPRTIEENTTFTAQ